ncbi:MAG: hypothetical protein A9181_03170 [Dehalococcoides mccartyi]|nr:MAG: hypothetical protein A9181_03170 [Dehalococcoides mccartyi]
MVCKICGAREHYTNNCPFTQEKVEHIQRSIKIENILKEEFLEGTAASGLAKITIQFKISNVADRIASLFK